MRGEKPMGKTYARVKIENYSDVDLARQGLKPLGDIRCIEADAMVDAGATVMCLPGSLIRKLGLSLQEERKVKTAGGIGNVRVFGTVQLTVMGRPCRVDVYELPETVQPLLGYVPLELLDLQVDPKGGRLVPNPEHGDEMILDLL